MSGHRHRAEPPVGDPSDVVEGALERVVYCNEETAWSVVRIAVPQERRTVTAVGSLLGIQPGENLRLRGWWVHDRKYGEQFRVHSYLTIQPSTLVGIEKYLASGLVPGLGRAIAARLVERFQLETLDVIEKQPERLREVEGIGPVRSLRIREAWLEQRAIKEVMIFLQSHGVSTAYAVRVFKQYGARAIAVVRQNPYQLASDVLGIGFKSTDKIAASLGIPRDSPQRAEAGVRYLLGELADQGHVFFPHERLVAAATQLLELDVLPVEQAIAAQLAAGALVREPLPDDDAIYLKALHLAESGAAARLRALGELPLPTLAGGAAAAIEGFERQRGLALADQQRQAVEQATQRKVLVITGGPGTGKTTIVNAILRLLEQHERRLVLCAPTGRAAKRLTETTGHEARTIHRLLEFSPRTQRFERNSQQPLEADTLIVDEASMIDIVLFHALVQALPPAAQLIVVGDVDQLPSVGPGNVLRDLIASGWAGVVRLTEIFRQAQRSQIVVNAHRINRGELPPTSGEQEAGELSDFYFIERHEPEQILATIKDLVAQRIPRRFAVDPTLDIQVLTPMRKGLLGVINLNAELQALLNPEGPALVRGSRLLRVGDKVMQLRNNYDLDVFNGDIGRVTSIDEEEQQLGVSYDERLVRYEHGQLDELVLAYACSIHKAQGSEYPVVVLPLHTQHYAMLQRNLLYTGITRARRLVVIVGSRKALGLAVRNDRVEQRCSRLGARLQAADAEETSA
ncbi:MAG: ATP-dependent RecD-like DNA helicase [Proteobacteria bacterium]|nr:ATP-dependent RecD-like DNA helicase [Pseudomonadota bacterium]